MILAPAPGTVNGAAACCGTFPELEVGVWLLACGDERSPKWAAEDHTVQLYHITGRTRGRDGATKSLYNLNLV